MGKLSMYAANRPSFYATVDLVDFALGVFTARLANISGVESGDYSCQLAQVASWGPAQSLNYQCRNSAEEITFSRSGLAIAVYTVGTEPNGQPGLNLADPKFYGWCFGGWLQLLTIETSHLENA